MHFQMFSEHDTEDIGMHIAYSKLFWLCTWVPSTFGCESCDPLTYYQISDHYTCLKKLYETK